MHGSSKRAVLATVSVSPAAPPAVLSITSRTVQSGSWMKLWMMSPRLELEEPESELCVMPFSVSASLTRRNALPHDEKITHLCGGSPTSLLPSRSRRMSRTAATFAPYSALESVVAAAARAAIAASASETEIAS